MEGAPFHGGPENFDTGTPLHNCISFVGSMPPRQTPTLLKGGTVSSEDIIRASAKQLAIRGIVLQLYGLKFAFSGVHPDRPTQKWQKNPQ